MTWNVFCYTTNLYEGDPPIDSPTNDKQWNTLMWSCSYFEKGVEEAVVLSVILDVMKLILPFEVYRLDR